MLILLLVNQKQSLHNTAATWCSYLKIKVYESKYMEEVKKLKTGQNNMVSKDKDLARR